MRLIIIVLSLLCTSTLVLAETSSVNTAPIKKLLIELNSQKQVGTSCQVSFLMKNDLGQEIKQFTFEIVIFDENQQVVKLLVLNSGELIVGKTRVKRYGLKNVNCQKVSRYLVNDIKQCDAKGFTPKLCLQSLVLTNKTNAKFGS